MPELPDIQLYAQALRDRTVGRKLTTVRLANPFLLRTVDPKVGEFEGTTLTEIRTLGKRIVLCFETDIFAVLHLMIAGRLWWKDEAGAAIAGGKRGLAAFDFESGTLLMTEAGTKKRASLHLVRGEASLLEHDRGGIDVFKANLDDFTERLTQSNHTLKRSLTDPRLYSGIGNAYSDEILHAAKLSPIAMSQKLTVKEITRLYDAVKSTLELWCERLNTEAGGGWPEKVTAFRAEMAAHGKFGKPCPVCGTAIQRIRYASNETNYCPRCQTDGKVLADRSLSRLLKKDWPRTVEELENAKRT